MQKNIKTYHQPLAMRITPPPQAHLQLLAIMGKPQLSQSTGISNNSAQLLILTVSIINRQYTSIYNAYDKNIVKYL